MTKILKNLLLYDRRYRHLIRYYNNRFSFASFNDNVVNEYKSGICNFKIEGQVGLGTSNSICTKKIIIIAAVQLQQFQKRVIFQQLSIYLYMKCLPKGVDFHLHLNKLSFHINPMTFPIMFLCGDLRCSPFLTHYNRAKRLSVLQYYSYRLAYRLNEKFNSISCCDSISQQYVIQAYHMFDSNRLNSFRFNILKNCV